MNILLLTNSMKQPDDIYSSKTDVVFFFAKEWVKAGHRVVIIHSETKFPLFYYWIPKSIASKIVGGRFSSFPSVSSRKILKRAIVPRSVSLRSTPLPRGEARAEAGDRKGRPYEQTGTPEQCL